MEEQQQEMWAVVELMGHGRTAGRIRLSDLGGLLRVDVPTEDNYRTEFYGAAAVYSVKIVSEEVARAYASPARAMLSYDEPIVPREQYEAALSMARADNDVLLRRIRILEQRLTTTNLLPAPANSTDEIEF